MPSDTAYDLGAHLNFEDVSVDTIKNPQSLSISSGDGHLRWKD